MYFSRLETEVNQTCRIEEIVDLRALQEILDTFFDATNLIRIGLKDPEGKTLISAYKHTLRSSFCRLIRTCPEGVQRCQESDRWGVQQAATRRAPFIYTCHAGLTDFTVPIIFQGECLGALMSGQVLLSPLMPEKEKEILARCADLPIEQGKLRHTLREVAVIPYSALESGLRLLFIIAQYVTERELKARTEAQLIQEKLYLAQERQHAAELESDLHRARLQSLQSQINSHFLFNSLNTIARLAVLEKAPQTERMTYALARLLRYSLRKVDTLVPLAEEMDQASSYLEIQKARFQDRLDVKVTCEPTCREFQLPCMTLQPLVENALIHGLEPKPGSGCISVSAQRQNDEVVIEITDTGVGMSPEHLAEVLSEKDRVESRGHTSGLGIRNVRQRLHHCFGGQFSLKISSEEGKGTRVILRFPHKLLTTG